jgi:hypothetical protein
MAKLEAGLKELHNVAPGICGKFTKRLQVQRLREDPDFNRDLEGMNASRVEPLSPVGSPRRPLNKHANGGGRVGAPGRRRNYRSASDRW